MSKKQQIKPQIGPDALTPARRETYNAINERYEMQAQTLDLVVSALRLLDSADAADEELGKCGSLFVTTNRGPAEHPLARLSRNNRSTAAGILSRLGLLGAD